MIIIDDKIKGITAQHSFKLCGVPSVSYTHLDVYKRQDLDTFRDPCRVDSGSIGKEYIV